MSVGYKILPDGEQSSRSEPRANLARSQWVTELFAGVLASILILVVNVSAASVVFHKGYEFEQYLSHGINMFLLCTGVSNAIMLLTSHMPLISGANAFVASLFVGMAVRILESHPDSALGTLVVAMGFCTLVLGICHWILGAARIGKVVQFVPTPVMFGFQASIGYVLINSSIEMLCGCSLTDVQCLYYAKSLDQLFMTAALGVWLTVAQSYLKGVWRIMLIPSTLLVVISVFLVVRPQMSAEALHSWSLNLPAESALGLYPKLELKDASWTTALFEGARTAAIAIVPNVINILLTFSALEQRRDSEVDVEYDYELRSLGVVYAGTAGTMMAPNPQASVMLFVADLGARSRFAPCCVVITSFAVAAFGCDIVNPIPTVAFAGLLFSNGLILLSGQLIAAMQVLPRQEQVLVILHISLTTLLGMFAAVVLGLACTALMFIMEYSHHSGVMQCATSQLERSRVERPLHEQEYLQKEGSSIFIVHLHGMIFFGSANAVLETVRAHVKTLHKPLSCLVLDFERCSEVDSSAITVLFQAKRAIDSAQFVCASASNPILRKLLAASERVGENIFAHFPTLDIALEHCEALLLAKNDSPEMSFLEQVPETFNVDEDIKVYTPRSARSDLPLQVWEDARKRFVNQMVANGAEELESLFEHMDIVRMLPGVLIKTYCPGAGEQPREATRDLYIVDMGHVTTWLMMKTFHSGARGSPDLEADREAMDLEEEDGEISPVRRGTLSSLTRGGGRKPSKVLQNFLNSQGPSELHASPQSPNSRRLSSGSAEHRWHRLMKFGPGTLLNIGPFAAPPDPRFVQGRPVCPRVYHCDTPCQFFRLSRSRADELEREDPELMQKLYRLLTTMGDSFAANHAMALMASEAFAVTIRPSRAFGRWLLR